MDNILQKDDEYVSWTDKDIFTKIWTSPRQVFTYINTTHYDKYVTVLLILFGITRAFEREMVHRSGDAISIAEILIFCVLFGGISGWLSLNIYAEMISWVGKRMQGKADSDSILRILSYASFPSILALLLVIPVFAIFGMEAFQTKKSVMEVGGISSVIFYGIVIVQTILGCCTLVLSVIGVSELQKFSITQAILNLVLPLLMILIPVLILVILFKPL